MTPIASLLSLLLALAPVLRSNDQHHKGPVVLAIYPETDRIPVNVLRFYVQFSHPMLQGNSLSHIYLTDSAGLPLKFAFFDPTDELWNAQGTLLTLLLDPARVKTGLKAHQQLGRAFTQGCRYTLTIDTQWKTLSGDSLAAPFQKEFTASRPDTSATNASNWTFILPAAGSKTPFTICFHRSMDHLSAAGSIILLDQHSKRINGKITLAQKDSTWEFMPQKKWKKSSYRLLIDRRIEDIAGNNLNAPFDHPGVRKGLHEATTAVKNFIIE